MSCDSLYLQMEVKFFIWEKYHITTQLHTYVKATLQDEEHSLLMLLKFERTKVAFYIIAS